MVSNWNVFYYLTWKSSFFNGFLDVRYFNVIHIFIFYGVDKKIINFQNNLLTNIIYYICNLLKYL